MKIIYFARSCFVVLASCLQSILKRFFSKKSSKYNKYSCGFFEKNLSNLLYHQALKSQNMTARSIKWILLLFSVFLLVNCSSIGPGRIYMDRNSYNDAITNTDDEQLLRNIVRLRYLEQISFLKITNVTSSYSLNQSLSSSLSLSGSASQGSASTTSRSASLSPSMSYSDSPTISYVPVTSSDFAQQMLSPVQLNQLALLLNGGMHDPNLLFKLTMQSINDIDNASDASDLKVLSPPDYEQFHCITKLLTDLIKKKGAKFIAVKVKDKITLAVRFSKKYNYSCEARAFKKALHIPAKYQDVILSQEPIDLPNVAVVHTRSILGIMIYVSHGVTAPEEHHDSDLALNYKVDPKSKVRYNWEPLMNGIIKIYDSKEEPTMAFVKVHMFDYWYYIKWGDFNSIATFNFINGLIVLSAGNALSGVSAAPVVTIPIR